MDIRDIKIEKASAEDAEEILKLQKLAYVSEAEIINDFTIPPLHQTIEEVLSEFDNHMFLKVTDKNMIIGSVRSFVENGTCFIGKLIVHPDHQNQGLGTELLKTIERYFPDTGRYELFTGEKSERNLYLYQKMGYRIFKNEKISKNLTLVYLEKPNCRGGILK